MGRLSSAYGKVACGLYRTPGWAYVIDGMMELDIPEADYRATGYEPGYDSLPSKEDYEATQAKSHDGH